MLRNAAFVWGRSFFGSTAPLRQGYVARPFATSKQAAIPKRTKHKKAHRGRAKGVMCHGSHLAFGKFGIKTLEAGRLTMQTIEAARRVMSRKIKGTGQMWVRVYANIPVTSKPAEVRMGKGKGNISGWIARVKAGQVLYEMDNIPAAAAQQTAIQVGHKIGLKTKFMEWS